MTVMNHIQKIAPAPPRQMAVDTPTMFPVPTRDAVETINAPNDEMPCSCSGFSRVTRSISKRCRICGKPKRTERKMPATIRNSGMM